MMVAGEQRGRDRVATLSINWKQRVSGGLVGLLVGDALGVPYEFHPPESIPRAALIEYVPPPGFQRAHVGVPPGTWSDDGAQALILLDSLLACDGLNLVHFAGGLRRWLMEGFYAVNRSVFDIGAQTSTALNNLGLLRRSRSLVTLGDTACISE